MPSTPGWPSGPQAESAGPDTDRDPIFYTPRPGNGVRAEGGAAATASGMEQQGADVALRLISALIEADADGLRELFEESLLRAGKKQNVPGSKVVEQCLEQALRLGWQTGIRVDDVLETNSITVRRAADASADRAPPAGIRPTDLQVDLQLRQDGPRPASLCFQRAAGTARFYERPGARPRVVSF